MLYGSVTLTNIYQQTPYFDKNREKIYKKVIFNDIDFNPVVRSSLNNTTITEDAKDLIQKLLKKNPKERMKIVAVKEHPFFKEINFTDLLALKMEPPFKPNTVKLGLMQNTESRFIDPKLHLEQVGDSLYNGLSPMNNKGKL